MILRSIRFHYFFASTYVSSDSNFAGSAPSCIAFISFSVNIVFPSTSYFAINISISVITTLNNCLGTSDQIKINYRWWKYWTLKISLLILNS